MSAPVRVRFAPSPTGYLHVGGARSALFNFLFARHNKGTFILRIEDTDRSRYQADALEEIYTSLKWLGLDWDEGPGKAGSFGPYIQSERTELYQNAAQVLIEKGHAYRCFCTPERLGEVRKEQEKAGTTMGYDRHCRALSEAEVNQLLAEKKPFVVRLKIPLGRTVVFDDLIRGRIEYQSDVLDDLVLLKSDGFPTYHLANIVDDHHMQISHVLRGDEWISSTPRHILLYEAFGWSPPVFAHLPVILDPSGGKLSKRKGAASVMDYQRLGYLPEALFNFLALLGWAPGDDKEKMTLNELIDKFDLLRVSAKPAVFDEKKLEWMNGHYLTDAVAGHLAPIVVPQWKEKGWVKADAPEADTYLLKAIDMLKVRSKKLGDIVDVASYFFIDPVSYEDKAAKKHFTKDAVNILKSLSEKLEPSSTFTHASIENVYREYAEQTALSGGVLIHPTRLAISGISFGPGLFEMMELLGKDTVIRRMKTAVSWIEKNS
jgi:glutamyl-tRNA synthetase